MNTKTLTNPTLFIRVTIEEKDMRLYYFFICVIVICGIGATYGGISIFRYMIADGRNDQVSDQSQSPELFFSNNLFNKIIIKRHNKRY